MQNAKHICSLVSYVYVLLLHSMFLSHVRKKWTTNSNNTHTHTTLVTNLTMSTIMMACVICNWAFLFLRWWSNPARIFFLIVNSIQYIEYIHNCIICTLSMHYWLTLDIGNASFFYLLLCTHSLFFFERKGLKFFTESSIIIKKRFIGKGAQQPKRQHKC